jgi:hypothetical protein
MIVQHFLGKEKAFGTRLRHWLVLGLVRQHGIGIEVSAPRRSRRDSRGHAGDRFGTVSPQA